MNNRFFSAVALLATLMLVGSTIAEAADIKFSGQLRPRFEFQDRNTNVDTDANTVVDGRVRLNALATIDSNTSAFIQMQAIRSWGQAHGGDASGSQQGAFVANDTDSSVGVHQAYFTLKNFWGLPIDLQMGRQEFILDGHRIFGDTLWTAGEQTHEGLRLSHSNGNHQFVYFYSRAINVDASEASNATTDHDNNVGIHAGYAKFKGILGGALSLHFDAILDDRTDNSDNDIYNLGFRQAGVMNGIKYRAEFYYQFGDSESHGSGFDHEAYMAGIRVSKAFSGSMKPGLTLWFDYLSGTDQDDLNDSEVSTFDTFFDTGHKFYGFMDYWLNIGAAGRNGSVLNDQLNGLGLIDFAVKGKISPAANWILKGDLHWFWTAQDAFNNTSGLGQTNTFQAGNIGDNDLGQELDITLVHNYNPSTNIVFGYSHFFSDELMADINHRFDNSAGAGNGDDGDWAYIMVDVQF